MGKYLLGKNKQWTKEIMHLVYWDAMGAYMKELGGTRATNIVKYAHNWKNDGQRKAILYGPSKEVEYPVKYGTSKSIFTSYHVKPHHQYTPSDQDLILSNPHTNSCIQPMSSSPHSRPSFSIPDLEATTSLTPYRIMGVPLINW